MLQLCSNFYLLKISAIKYRHFALCWKHLFVIFLLFIASLSSYFMFVYDIRIYKLCIKFMVHNNYLSLSKEKP